MPDVCAWPLACLPQAKQLIKGNMHKHTVDSNRHTVILPHFHAKAELSLMQANGTNRARTTLDAILTQAFNTI